MRYGRWWSVLPVQERCLSLGVHLDTRARRTAGEGLRYGPYVDLHLGWVIVSVGVNPIYAGEVDLLIPSARGGVSGDRQS